MTYVDDKQFEGNLKVNKFSKKIIGKNNRKGLLYYLDKFIMWKEHRKKEKWIKYPNVKEICGDELYNKLESQIGLDLISYLETHGEILSLDNKKRLKSLEKQIKEGYSYFLIKKFSLENLK